MNGRRWRVVGSIGLIVATVGLPGRGKAPTTSAPVPGWTLAWADEFDGRAIDRTKWDFDLGTGWYSEAAKTWIAGWGNDERQTYTDRPDNAWVADGLLHIRAKRELRDRSEFTSARLKTRRADGKPLFGKTYGRFEFRARLPLGRGLWPALWLLPQEDRYGVWAASGEIDVMEARGQNPREVLGTLHFGAGWPGNAHQGATYRLPEAGGGIDAFHVYALEWEPGTLRWYVDGTLTQTQASWWSSSVKQNGPTAVVPRGESDLNPWPAPFDQPFYLVMNLAVGGKFLGDPDGSTPFPSEMVVDYVRVYDRVGGYGPPGPRGAESLPFRRP